MCITHTETPPTDQPTDQYIRWWYLYSVTARERNNKFARFTQITQTDWPTDWLRDKHIKCTPHWQHYRWNGICIDPCVYERAMCVRLYRNSLFFFSLLKKCEFFPLKKAQRGGKRMECWLLLVPLFCLNFFPTQLNHMRVFSTLCN